MDSTILSSWFQEEFVPSVRKYLCGSSLPPKALLLLDNAISHPYIDVLQSSDKNISAMYLLANTTFLIQPMDQGVLVTLKRHYKRALLKNCLFLMRKVILRFHILKQYKRLHLNFCSLLGPSKSFKVMVKIA